MIPVAFLNFYGNYRVLHRAPAKVYWPVYKSMIHENRRISSPGVTEATSGSKGRHRRRLSISLSTATISASSDTPRGCGRSGGSRLSCTAAATVPAPCVPLRPAAAPLG